MRDGRGGRTDPPLAGPGKRNASPAGLHPPHLPPVPVPSTAARCGSTRSTCNDTAKLAGRPAKRHAAQNREGRPGQLQRLVMRHPHEFTS